MLDSEGRPTITERAWMAAPASRIGPATLEEKHETQNTSPLAGKYDTVVDRESAYEILGEPGAQPAQQEAQPEPSSEGAPGAMRGRLNGATGPPGGPHLGVV